MKNKILPIILLTILLLSTSMNSSAQADAPIITGDESVQISALQTVILNWTISDNNPRAYSVLSNEQVVSEGGWEDTESDLALDWFVSYQVNVNQGSYTVVLIVVDYDNQSDEFETVVIAAPVGGGGSNVGLPLPVTPTILAFVGIALMSYRRRD